MAIQHPKKNTLRIVGEEVFYFNVLNFEKLDGESCSFTIGEETTCSKYPNVKSVKAGSPEANSDSLIIGRKYTVIGKVIFSEDPAPEHHVHEHSHHFLHGFGSHRV